jgi:hypothetical protein
LSKNCLAAYIPLDTDGVNDRYKAAGEPVDMETLKISQEDEDEDEPMEVDAEEEEEDEDAALEDVKDLYEDDTATGKKRKRSETDDGDEKVGKKKVYTHPRVPLPPARSLPTVSLYIPMSIIFYAYLGTC